MIESKEEAEESEDENLICARKTVVSTVCLYDGRMRCTAGQAVKVLTLRPGWRLIWRFVCGRAAPSQGQVPGGGAAKLVVTLKARRASSSLSFRAP